MDVEGKNLPKKSQWIGVEPAHFVGKIVKGGDDMDPAALSVLRGFLWDVSRQFNPATSSLPLINAWQVDWQRGIDMEEWKHILKDECMNEPRD